MKYHATVSAASVTELLTRNMFSPLLLSSFFFIKPAAQDYDVSSIVSFFVIARYTYGGKCVQTYRT